jgi:hypothetical protein
MTIYKKWSRISTGNTRPIGKLCIETVLHLKKVYVIYKEKSPFVVTQRTVTSQS